MGLLERLLDKSSKNKKEFKEKFKQAQENAKIEGLLLERSKSSNERELESYMEEQRENKIKEHLSRIHKKKNKEIWKSEHPIMGQKMTILNNDRPILKEKNIFMHNKNNNKIDNNRMFFK